MSDVVITSIPTVSISSPAETTIVLQVDEVSYRLKIPEQGPRGSKGEDGPEGPMGPAGESLFDEVYFRATEDGRQTFQLPYKVSQYRLISINGLIQPNSSFSVTGTTLFLPESLSIEAGDCIRFLYSYQEA